MAHQTDGELHGNHGPLRGFDPSDFLVTDKRDRLAAHWDRLQGLGFELEIEHDRLRVHHGNRGFDAVIHLSHPADLGERRQLFESLKHAFGKPSDRFLSWILRPSQAVTLPYESLREVIALCQDARETARHLVSHSDPQRAG